MKDHLLVCLDCACAIGNDDFTGMDDEQENVTCKGIERLSMDGYLVIGKYLGFQHSGCDCCLDGNAGAKYQLSVIEDILW